MKLNHHLTVSYYPSYEGYSLQEKYAPYYEEYLAKIKSTIDQALNRYPSILAIRVDLRYPAATNEYDSKDISRFIDSLCAKLKAGLLRNKKKRVGEASEMFYVWSREFGQINGRPHYHLLILLNGDDFTKLGRLSKEGKSLFASISQAWSSALGERASISSGVPIHIPDNPIYTVGRGDAHWNLAYCDLFYRASYLAKVETKLYGDNKRSFSTGRMTLA